MTNKPCYAFFMKRERFEMLDHIADIQVRVHGDNLKELFSNAAYALFSSIADLANVTASTKVVVEARAADLEGLLVQWLSELLFLFETRQLLFVAFDIKDITDTVIKADVFGEKLDREKHAVNNEIKAVTYHQLKIEKLDDHWIAEIIFDI